MRNLLIGFLSVNLACWSLGSSVVQAALEDVEARDPAFVAAVESLLEHDAEIRANPELREIVETMAEQAVVNPRERIELQRELQVMAREGIRVTEVITPEVRQAAQERFTRVQDRLQAELDTLRVTDPGRAQKIEFRVTEAGRALEAFERGTAYTPSPEAIQHAQTVYQEWEMGAIAQGAPRQFIQMARAGVAGTGDVMRPNEIGIPGIGMDVMSVGMPMGPDGPPTGTGAPSAAQIAQAEQSFESWVGHNPNLTAEQIGLARTHMEVWTRGQVLAIDPRAHGGPPAPEEAAAARENLERWKSENPNATPEDIASAETEFEKWATGDFSPNFTGTGGMLSSVEIQLASEQLKTMLATTTNLPPAERRRAIEQIRTMDRMARGDMTFGGGPNPHATDMPFQQIEGSGPGGAPTAEQIEQAQQNLETWVSAHGNELTPMDMARAHADFARWSAGGMGDGQFGQPGSGTGTGWMDVEGGRSGRVTRRPVYQTTANAPSGDVVEQSRQNFESWAANANVSTEQLARAHADFNAWAAGNSGGGIFGAPGSGTGTGYMSDMGYDYAAATHNISSGPPGSAGAWPAGDSMTAPDYADGHAAMPSGSPETWTQEQRETFGFSGGQHDAGWSGGGGYTDTWSGSGDSAWSGGGGYAGGSGTYDSGYGVDAQGNTWASSGDGTWTSSTGEIAYSGGMGMAPSEYAYNGPAYSGGEFTGMGMAPEGGMPYGDPSGYVAPGGEGWTQEMAEAAAQAQAQENYTEVQQEVQATVEEQCENYNAETQQCANAQPTPAPAP